MAEAAEDRYTAPAGPGGLLPESGVKDLTDRLTEYMTEIELADVPAVLEQVLEGRAPHLVERFVEEALEKWGHIHLEDETQVTDEDLEQLVERVLPKLRRWRYYLGRESEESADGESDDV